MWFIDFLVTVFVAPFIIVDGLAKGFGWGISTSRYKIREAKDEKRMNKWYELMTDEEMSKALYRRIIDKDESLVDELNGILELFPWIKEQNIRTLRSQFSFCGISFDLARLLLLANRGKLPREIARMGLDCNLLMPNRYLNKIYNPKDVYKLMLWLSEKIGTSEALYQENRDNYEINIVECADDVKTSIRNNYAFMWWPMVCELKRTKLKTQK